MFAVFSVNVTETFNLNQKF